MLLSVTEAAVLVARGRHRAGPLCECALLNESNFPRTLCARPELHKRRINASTTTALRLSRVRPERARSRRVLAQDERRRPADRAERRQGDVRDPLRREPER